MYYIVSNLKLGRNIFCLFIVIFGITISIFYMIIFFKLKYRKKLTNKYKYNVPSFNFDNTTVLSNIIELTTQDGFF